MPSGFVSGGTIERPLDRDDEWLKAQLELEATRKRKDEESRHDGGKSLYEVLQQNKAAKQDAFEESIRLKNQFRNLDEDEVDFLDSVLESTRAKEEAVKKKTAEQLDLFRQQQEDADRARAQDTTDANDEARLDNSGSPTLEEPSWVVSNRKRKRAKDKEVVKGVKQLKQRKSSQKMDNAMPMSIETQKDSSYLPGTVNSSSCDRDPQKSMTGAQSSGADVARTKFKADKAGPVVQSSIATNLVTKPGLLGLGDYDSDEDT